MKQHIFLALALALALSARAQDECVLLTDSDLVRGQIGLCVYDITADTLLCEYNAGWRMRPASTEKVVTAIAALRLLGPDYPITTQVLADGTIHDGTLQGNLVVVTAMDPLLSHSDVRSLVDKVRQAGIARIDGQVLFDTSMKDTLLLGWGWCWDDDNPTLTPLLVDGKAGLDVAFLDELQRAGVQVGAVQTLQNTVRVTIATVSHTLAQVLQPMLKDSNNQCAESVFYQMGSSRQDVAEHIAAVMLDAGADPSPTLVADGSGLSLYNYQTPLALVRLLTYVSRDALRFPAFWQSLPIAGQDGTLKRRMRDTPAALRVRAKTGSVTGVSSLAGYIQPLGTDHLLAFAIIVTGMEHAADARALQDRICNTLVNGGPCAVHLSI